MNHNASGSLASMEESQRLYQEAVQLFHSGRLNEALMRLERSLALDPKFPDALESLGVLYAKADRIDEAIETMKRLVKISPNHIMAHTNLSRFYVQKGMILEAEAEQAEARRLSWKEELKAQKLTGSTHEKTPEEEAVDQAKEIQSRIERYQKVIDLDPKDVLGYFSFGSACLEAKRLEEARCALAKAIQVDPKHSPSYFMLGVALEALHQKEEAVKIYEAGVQAADSKGDMIPLRKMEARLRMLRSEN